MSNPGEYIKPEYLDGTTARLAARLPSDEMNKLGQEIMEIVDNHTPEEGAPLVAKTIKDAVYGDVCDWLADHLKGQPQGTTIKVGDAVRMYTMVMLGERNPPKGAPHLRSIKGGGE